MPNQENTALFRGVEDSPWVPAVRKACSSGAGSGSEAVGSRDQAFDGDAVTTSEDKHNQTNPLITVYTKDPANPLKVLRSQA